MMSTPAEFTVLGSWEIRIHGRPVVIPPGQLRILLVALLVSVNQPVTADTLCERLWPDQQPSSARASLHTYVGRLRQLIGKDLVQRVSAGRYQLNAEADQVDLHRFRLLLGQARQVTGSSLEHELLREAGQLWQGRPFADVPSPWLEREVVPRLTEEWFAVTERRIDIELGTRPPASLLPELRGLTRHYPARESLWARLIRALRDAGLRDEAIQAYQKVRAVLGDQFGIDPGPELESLHQEISQGQTAVPAVDSMMDSSSVTSRQLPHAIGRFTGREEELRRLNALLTNRSGAPVIVSIDGAPGIGKTVLALRWAHQVAHQYSDVQLYLNMRGYGPGEPVRPDAAAEAFLRELGVGSEDIPSDMDERSALLRSTLADRRPLIVLDNARDAGQVRPLLPGTSALVIVTSRNQLRGLTVRDGAYRVTLNPLPHNQSISLLAAAIGQRRVAGEPEAAARLVELCANLPLALAIVAERAHRTGSLADVVCALEDEKARLDNLGSGDDDPHTDLRAALSWSYRALGDTAATMFRKLGLYPADDIALDTAAALAGLPIAEAQAAFDQLIATNLVEQRRPGRYQLHDLIRLYANDLAMTHDQPAAREATIRQVLDWYLHSVVNADELLMPYRNREFMAPHEPRGPVRRFDDAQQASDWVEREYDSLLSVAAWAVEHGQTGYAWRIALSLTTFFDAAIPWRDGLKFYQFVLRACEDNVEPLGAAYISNSLGCIHLDKTDWDTAGFYFRRALHRFQQLGKARLEAMALGNLSMVHAWSGSGELAREHATRALEICLGLDSPRGIAMNHDNLGLALAVCGDYREAVQCHLRAHEIFLGCGDITGAAFGQHHLGMAYFGCGEVGKAIRALRMSISLHEATANRRWRGIVLTDLGKLLNEVGHTALARNVWETAMDTLKDFADPRVPDIEAALAQLA